MTSTSLKRVLVAIGSASVLGLGGAALAQTSPTPSTGGIQSAGKSAQQAGQAAEQAGQAAQSAGDAAKAANEAAKGASDAAKSSAKSAGQAADEAGKATDETGKETGPQLQQPQDDTHKGETTRPGSENMQQPPPSSP